jgi:hypothetical protein
MHISAANLEDPRNALVITVQRLRQNRIAVDIAGTWDRDALTAALTPDQATELAEMLLALAHGINVGQ